MALVTTPAIVLHAFSYSETSKVVRLATRDLGVQSAIAKGVRRARSPVGARLESFSEGRAVLYVREHRELHTLATFDLERHRGALARDLTRFVSASVLAELVLRCAPAAPHEPAYEALRLHLDLLATAAPEVLEAAALRALWRLVTALGFAPSLDACARDGAPLGTNGRIPFSVAEGGALCPRCASGRETSRLAPTDFRALGLLVRGSPGFPPLSPRHAAAHRRLVARFIRAHLAEDRPLEALAIWERRPWIGTSS